MLQLHKQQKKRTDNKQGNKMTTELIKITKKEFLKLHSRNELELIQASSKNLMETHAILKAHKTALTGVPVSNIDLDNQGEYMKTKCFRYVKQNVEYYYVASEINHAENQYSSRTHKEYYTVIYRQLTNN